ncbi:MAG: radical SAM protein [Deltaproteobacteria bacterium]|nr:radical SAM protein [Deltaproteobacteria bacterium]
MKVALVYPPACDPTAPYLAIPTLTGFLRAHGVAVLPIDANVEAFGALLAEAPLAGLADRITARLAELDRRTALPHAEQLEYLQLARAVGDAREVPARIATALATLRDPVRFYDPAAYDDAVDTVEAALGVISAAHAPLHVDFTSYRTPFGLLTIDEVARETSPERDPFHAWTTGTLAPRLAAEGAGVVGISVCFPGQLQPAYTLAFHLRALLPDVHLTVGGPCITQMMIRLRGTALARALGPFDSAVVFEGEQPLLELVRALDEKRDLRTLTNVVMRDPLMGARYVPAHGMTDLRALPAPDFTGLPLDRYLSPTLTLPYDPTRGCYWGKCTFCHYGLAEVGTAAYRERDVDRVVEHLAALSARHGTRHFYFSQDSVAPKTLVKLATRIADSDLSIAWGTDLKPEKYLTRERAETLRRAGAVACALGVESAAPRVLSLIDKGAPIEVVGDVVEHLAATGIAPEAMCFTDFPTESRDEALATLRWLEARRDKLGLFIVGTFGLTHGALVAQDPAKFGLADTWQVAGDELGLGLFFAEARPSKTGADRARVDRALDRVAGAFRLRPYPWAGAVSTAHTLLVYARHGRAAFQRRAHADPTAAAPHEAELAYDVDALASVEERDAEIWSELVTARRAVSRAAYDELAAATPPATPQPSRYRFAFGEAPVHVGRRRNVAPNRLPPRT